MTFDQLKLELEMISESVIRFNDEDEKTIEIKKGIDLFGVIGFFKTRDINKPKIIQVNYYFPKEKLPVLLKVFRAKLGDSENHKRQDLKIKKEETILHNIKLPDSVGLIKHTYEVDIEKLEKDDIFKKFEKTMPAHFFKWKNIKNKIDSEVKDKKFIGVFIDQKENENIVLQYYFKKPEDHVVNANHAAETAIGDIERRIANYARRIQNKSISEDLYPTRFIEHHYEIF